MVGWADPFGGSDKFSWTRPEGWAVPASPGEEAREGIGRGMGLRKEDTNFKDPKEIPAVF